MRYSIRGGLAAFVCLFLAEPATAQVVRADAAWARAPAAPSGAVALYLTLHGGASADRLVGVETRAGGMGMLHESATENGVSVMRMLDGIDVPAGATVVLRPGGMHVMLEGLQHPPRAGDSLDVTLRFARAPAQTLQADVRPPGAPGP